MNPGAIYDPISCTSMNFRSDEKFDLILCAELIEIDNGADLSGNRSGSHFVAQEFSLGVERVADSFYEG